MRRKLERLKDSPKNDHYTLVFIIRMHLFFASVIPPVPPPSSSLSSLSCNARESLSSVQPWDAIDRLSSATVAAAAISPPSSRAASLLRGAGSAATSRVSSVAASLLLRRLSTQIQPRSSDLGPPLRSSCARPTPPLSSPSLSHWFSLSGGGRE